MDSRNVDKFHPPFYEKKPIKRLRFFLMVATTGIEPVTQGFSVLCSTD